MTISNLINYLEEAKKEHGDIEAMVKFRDNGGEYCGYDEYLYVEVYNEDGKEILVI